MVRTLLGTVRRARTKASRPVRVEALDVAETLRWSLGSDKRARGDGQPQARRRAGAVASVASVGLLLIAASFLAPATEAASTPTLTLTPTALVASTSGVSVALRYVTPARTATTVTLTVPAAWAGLVLPQTSRSSRAGYASLTRTGCGTTTRITSITRSTAKTATITVNSSCAAKGTWTLTIRGLTAPRLVGATTWTARVRTTSSSWRSTNFALRVGPGTLDVLLGGTVLPTGGTTRVPVYALARDAAARPLAGVPVRFSVSAGATIAPLAATTDRRGVATAYLVGATAPASPTVTIVATTSPLVASATLSVASTGTLTVEAVAGGTVSPSGTGPYALGSTVQLAITPTDPTSVPGVMVDGVPVTATPPVAPSTAWGVAVKVTGANRVDVSFAQLAPTTRVADAATGNAFTSVAPGGTSIRFSTRTPFLDGLAVGDILSTSQAAAAAGMAPVLLRITGVDRSGPGATFTTAPAQLTDALATASLDAHIPLVEQLPAATIPATLPATFSDPAPSLAAINLSGSATVGGWGDALTSQVGPVAVTGAYQVSGPTLNLSTTIGLSSVTAFRATVSETASASISLDGSSKSSSTERTLAHHAFNGDIVLGAIVVPYVVTVDAGAGVESQIGLAFHTKVGVSGTLETGVSYAASGGWSLVAKQDVSFPFDPPNVPAITGQVRGYPFLTVTPAIGFSYGVGPVSISLFCGPYVKAEPGFLELGADTSANPWAWLDAGVSVSGGARCSFGDPAELASVEVVRHRLWDSGGPLVPPTPSPKPTVPAPTPAPQVSLHDLVIAHDRAGIAAWGAAHSIAEINDAVASLSAADRSAVPGVVLDTNAQGAARDQILAAMSSVLTHSSVGFMVETWSYTQIIYSTVFWSGTCRTVWFDSDIMPTVPQDGVALPRLLLHEMFHSFAHCNGGPSGALDEGGADFISRAAGYSAYYVLPTLADGTYNAALYNRDVQHNPTYPIVAPSSSATQKYRDVMTWEASLDPSRLAWTSTTKLQQCFEDNFASLNWSTASISQWNAARAGELSDPNCHP